MLDAPQQLRWLLVGSDWMLAIASVSIAAVLFAYLRKRPDLAFRPSGELLAAFFAVLGISVGVDAVFSGPRADVVTSVLRGFTALLAAATCFSQWTSLPRALAMPRLDEVERDNRALRRMQDDLEERVRFRTAAHLEANLALRREMAERERAEGRFRLALEASPVGNVIVDAEGRIQTANHAAARIFGYASAELAGLSVERLVPEAARGAHPGFREKFLAEPRARPMGLGRSLRGMRKDGSEVAVEIGLAPFVADQGMLVLANVVDITERERAEGVAHAHSKDLERSNRALDEFAHVVSHDLKAPLRGIAALASWIQEDAGDALPEGAREHLRLLLGRVNRMAALIDGILDYSLIGRGPSETKRVATDSLARELCEVLAPPPAIALRVEGVLPDADYDEIQLGQVFQNLIDNAIQHLGRPAGNVVISGVERDDHVEFCVRDDGIGIDPKHHERIFRVFQSLHPGESSGLGIGLAIVKRSVERHGGRVWVESESNAGSVFRFTVPKPPKPA